jgi:hypothetical protein
VPWKLTLGSLNAGGEPSSRSSSDFQLTSGNHANRMTTAHPAQIEDLEMDRRPPPLTNRFLAAVSLAQGVHGGDRRSGTKIPYMAHLLVVTGLVIEDGGDEDQAIAAMLHDSVEDGGGRAMLDRIASEFGPRVAEIVKGLSDSLDGHPVEPWIERKRRYLEHLQTVEDEAVLRVALADKVNNARSIVRDYREEGQALWERFKEKSAGEQLWYYGDLLEFFERRRPSPLTEDLRRAVAELARLVASDQPQQIRQLRLWRASERRCDLLARRAVLCRRCHEAQVRIAHIHPASRP